MLKTCDTKSWMLAIGAALAVVCSVSPAWGALGGDISSVQADQLHMQGSLRTTSTAAYTVHEIQGANGMVVREYVSSASKVFGVAWQGPWRPDMRQILGNYFEQFGQAMQSRSKIRMGRRPVMIELPGLVVEQSGHARAFSGRAYVPEMLPTGVQIGEIQ